jgi:hypothetical protein
LALFRSLLVLFFGVGCFPAPAVGHNLTITSDPPGATVEVDSVNVGQTPLRIHLPGGYFKKTRWVWETRLGHPMIARISKEGYTSKEIELTYGPMEWISLNGTSHGDYWLLKADHFAVELERLSDTFTGAVETTLAGTKAVMRPEMTAEEVAQHAGAAVLKLTSGKGVGTGFFITDTGVIATNAHVAEGQTVMRAVCSSGKEFDAKVAYLDHQLDLAFLKVEGSGFPHLALADTSAVRPGQSVIAIGNPAKGLPNSVTKGIVSAVGRLENSAGTWVQTDAAINPGNTGGPLLDAWGEVIGITTQKQFLAADGRPLQGIGFALSSSDLIAMLHRFYPSASPGAVGPAEGQQQGTGTVSISSEPDGLEIYVDDVFVGDTPSTLKLSAGHHTIEVRGPGGQPWKRELEVIRDSQITLRAKP